MKKSKILLSLVLATSALSSFAVVLNKQNNYASAYAATHPDNYNSYTYSGTYYDNITATGEGLNGSLRTALSAYIKPKSTYTYGGSGDTHLSSVLQKADEDPANSSNMIYLYTRDSVKKNAASSWNREHVWPQSLSNDCWGTSGAGSDLLHIRPTYNTTNSTRGNDKYADCDGGSQVTYNSMPYGWTSGSYFEPLDSVKGDVARICMYVWVAWKNHYSNLPAVTNVFKNYDTLLKWHTMDAPDVMEGNRNNYSEKSNQKNRNPFVDHPEYAWMIFGDSASASVKAACQERYPIGGGGSDVPPTPDKTLLNIKITGTANKLSYYTGETFNPNGLTVTATYSDNSTSTIANSSCTWTPNPLTKGTTQVTCSYQGKQTTYGPISVSDRPVSGNGNYVIVNSVSELENATVLIGCKSSNVVAGAFGNASLGKVAATFKNNELETKPAGAVEYLVSKSGSSYKLTSSEGTLGATAVKKLSLDTGSTTWNISISNGTASISNTTGSYGTIYYNESASMFRNYNSSMKSVELYKKSENQQENIPVTSISLNKTSATLDVGEPLSLSATVLPENASNKEILWGTSDNSVASVTNGRVVANKGGQATITATTVDGNYQATCLITVRGEQGSVTSVKLNQNTLSMKKGETASLNATVLPENANNKNVTWSSSDESIVKVENGALTALNVGEATVTVTTVDGNYQDRCVVTVSDNENPNPNPEQPKEKKGCEGSIIATSAIISFTALLGLSFISLRKKHD